jgi:hypothetical protein
MTVIGALGTAGLLPGKEHGTPVWLVVGAAIAPLVLFELGAGIAVEMGTARSWKWGSRVQVAAAALQLASFGVAIALQSFTMRGVWLIVALAFAGVLASLVVLRDFALLGSGRTPVADDGLGAGRRIAARLEDPSARARLVDVVAVVGGMPILIGFVGLAFVAMAVLILLRDGTLPRRLSIGLVFFGGVALVAVAQGLERWETLVPANRVRRAREIVQFFSFLSFGGALAAMGFQMLSEPGESVAKAWFLVVGGVLFLAGGIVYVKRSVLGSAKSGFELVREGLLERARREWFVYPWSDVHSIALGEFRGMPALYVRLVEGAAVEPVHGDAIVGEREKRLARKKKSLAFSLTWFGADLVVLPVMTNVSIGDLYRGFEAALAGDSVRAALPSWRERLMNESALR